MPSKLLGTLFAAAVLSACVPASAINITIGPIDTSSPNRVAVTVTWPTTPPVLFHADPSPFVHPLGSKIVAADGYINDFYPAVELLVGVNDLAGGFYSEGLDRKLADITWILYGLATEVLPLADGNEYGGIFVFGDSYPHNGVPDNGASALLLSAGLAGLIFFRRTVV